MSLSDVKLLILGLEMMLKIELGGWKPVSMLCGIWPDPVVDDQWCCCPSLSTAHFYHTARSLTYSGLYNTDMAWAERIARFDEIVPWLDFTGFHLKQ